MGYLDGRRGGGLVAVTDRHLSPACACPVQHQLPLPFVFGQFRGPGKLRPRLLQAAELLQEVPPDARQQVIAAQLRFVPEPVHRIQPGLSVWRRLVRSDPRLLV